MDELFRFMVMRSPILDEPETDTPDRVLHIDTDSPFSKSVIDSVGDLEALLSIYGIAEELVNSSRYPVKNDRLVKPLEGIQSGIDLVLQKNGPLTLLKIKKAIEDEAQIAVDEFVVSNEFTDLRRNLSDSLIALTLLRRQSSKEYEKHAQGLRLCHLIERVANNDSRLTALEELEAAAIKPIVLPSEMFPLPNLPRITEPSQQLQPQESPEYSDEKPGSNASMSITHLLSSLEELTKINATDLKHHKQGNQRKIELPENNESIETNTFSTPISDDAWVLSVGAIKRASKILKQTTTGIGLNLYSSSLPNIIDALGSELSKRIQKLPIVEGMIDYVPIGNDLVPVGEIMGTALEFKPWHPPRLDWISQLRISEGAFREVGVSDLELVREDIARYEAGEIAHIENILKGETKERTHRRLERHEEYLLTETEVQEESERDLQSSERFEMQKETERSVEEQTALDVGVTVKYGGFVDVEASTRYANKISRKDSERTATTFAREVTERVVSKVRERVKERRTKTTVREIEESTIHGITNASGDDHIVGIYHWVDKVYNAQLLNYGKRTMAEFIVPEPAAFLLYSKAIHKKKGVQLSEPKVPRPFHLEINKFGQEVVRLFDGTPLLPEHISEYLYNFWVAQYRIVGVDPPPPKNIWKSYTWQSNKISENVARDLEFKWDGTTTKLELPEGYRSIKAVLSIQQTGHGATGIGENGSYGFGAREETTVWVHLGDKIRVYSGHSRNANDTDTLDLARNSEVPITISCVHANMISVTIELQCERTPEAMSKWRQDTYDKIVTAYNNLKSEFDEQVSAAAVLEGVEISGKNPEINREVELVELKKSALALLSHQHLDHVAEGGSSITGGYPEINVDKLNIEAPIMQFLEQAFEWNHMMYHFYPYFWGRKDRWPLLRNLNDSDPIHARFLQAGAARVVVPIRPGYEWPLRWYYMTGIPWAGKGPPSVLDDSFLPIIEEYKETRGIEFTDAPGTVCVRKSKNIVVFSQDSELTNDDVDREIRIHSKNYRIKSVDVQVLELELTETYDDENEDDISFALSGYKLVGDPWEIKVPTSLVYLDQEENPLPPVSH